jgi:hypothetical protein
LWATLDEGANTTAVWAIVVPERAIYTSGQPVTNLTRVNLSFNASLNRWQATWSPGPQYTGLCTVTYFAMSEDSLKTRLLAVPISSALAVVGPTSVRLPWQRME